MEIRRAEIKTEFIKLDALLKYSGAAITGGEAKQYIEMKQVLVDGQPCMMRRKKVYPGQKVIVGGQIEIHVEREEK